MNEQSQAATDAAHRQGRIAHNFIYLGGGQVLSALLGLLLTASLARSLGPSEFGLYFLIITIAGFVSVGIDWGQNNYVVREIARGRTDRDQFMGSAALLRAIATVLAAGLAFVIAVVSGYPALVVGLAALAVLTGAPGLYVQFLGYALRGIDRTDLDVLAQLAAKALGVVVTLVALYLGGGLPGVVLASAVGGLAALCLTFRMFTRTGMRLARPAAGTMQELLVAGVPLVAMSLSIAVHGFIDVTLLAMLATPAVVGWYGAARAFIGILVSPAMILATASFPDLCRVSGFPAELERVLSASARLLLAAGALVSCGTFVLAPAAVRLVYGQDHYDPAALILQVSAPFFPIFFINFLMGNTAVAIGKSVQIAIAKSVCVVISAVLSWFLIAHFQATIGNGAVGLMLSFCATEILMTLAYVTILPRGTITGTTIGHFVRAYLVAGLAAYVSARFVTVVPLWLAIGLVPAIFCLVALLAGLFRLSDIDSAIAMGRSFLTKLAKTAS